jgi:hypothetical protein
MLILKDNSKKVKKGYLQGQDLFERATSKERMAAKK